MDALIVALTTKYIIMHMVEIVCWNCHMPLGVGSKEDLINYGEGLCWTCREDREWYLDHRHEIEQEDKGMVDDPGLDGSLCTSRICHECGNREVCDVYETCVGTSDDLPF